MRIIVALLATLTVIGCASLGSSAPNREEVIQRLESEIRKLQQEATVSSVEITRLKKRLVLLEAKVEGQTEGKTIARKEKVRSAPTLRFEEEPQIEETELASPPPPTPRAPAIVAPRSPRETAVAGQETYDVGYTHYHQGRYAEAESQFQRFLLANPESELADNAQFWVGASRLSMKDVEGALQAFREAIQRYPEGNKVPDSLLKMGECLQTLGDEEAARAAWEELVKRYPETGAAALAAEKLGR